MVVDSIYDRAQTTPRKIALVCNGQPVSYQRFARGIESVRQAMKAHGLPPGSTAIVAIEGLLDGWTMVLALRSLGLRTVAVSDLDEAPALGLEQVSCVVTDPHKAGHSHFIAGSWPRARLIRVPATIYHALPDGPSPHKPIAAVAPGGHLLYTSGTTGTYKTLLQDAAHEDERNARRAASYGLGVDSAWYVGFLGLWTAVGYKMPMAVWQQGGCVVFDQRPTWAQEFLRRAPCDTVLTPQMVKELLDVVAREPGKRGPGFWRLYVTAGFLSGRQAREVLAQLTTALGITYGATELATPVLESMVTSLDDLHWLAPASGRVVEIVDERGAVCAEGEEGLLRVKLTPLDSSAYQGDSDASHKVFRLGYFYPGDMAVRRADGRIRVLGRSADVLNLQGRKVAAAPVEQAIQDWLGVQDVCIFSGICADGEDEVVVALETDKQLSAEQLDALRRQLAGFERVRLILSAQFPRTATGTNKVNRKALRRQLFARGQDSQRPEHEA